VSSPASDDAAALARHAATLADAVEGALPGWVARCVARFVPVEGDVRIAVDRAGAEARRHIGTAVRALLETDVDAQRGNPLALLRRGVRYPTEVLRGAGVPAVARDEFAARVFPEDDYDLSPATFADVDPALAEPGLVWGAAKAHVVKQRRRAEGRR
jgi:hypothetical protein